MKQVNNNKSYLFPKNDSLSLINVTAKPSMELDIKRRKTNTRER